MRRERSYKVLLVDGSDFDSYPLGGINYFVRNFLKFSADRTDMQLRLAGITCRKKQTLGKWLKVKMLGREWICFHFACFKNDLRRKPFVPVRITSFLSLLHRLRALRQAEVDCIYVHLPELAFLFCLFSPSQVPIVFHLHGVIDQAVTASRYQRLNNTLVLSLFRFMNRYVIKRAAAVITVSQEGYDLCTGILGQAASRVHKLPVAVNQSIFKPLTKEQARSGAQMADDATILLYVGRIEKVKGLSLLIDALAVLARTRTDVHLLLVGEGSEKESLLEYARNRGLSHRVTFPGYIDHDLELVYWMNMADVFVLSSYGEGCPTAVLEAQSCAIPVVATRVGELGDIIKPGFNGFLADDRDPAHFAGLVEKALQQRKVLAENSRAASHRYSYEVVGQKIIEILFNAQARVN
jgi:glycosyltransferase involved in cell wall biosynthesis